MPEGEEKEQEIVNLFEKIMKENFPSGMKEIDMQIQEAQRIPNMMDAKWPTLRHIIIKMTKVKHKEKILKAAREKKIVTYRGVPLGCQLIPQKKPSRLEGIGKKYSNHEKQRPTAKTALLSEDII